MFDYILIYSFTQFLLCDNIYVLDIIQKQETYMNKTIDARGKNCPIPVIMSKKEIENNIEAFKVLVDNKTAVENLKRLATNSNYKIMVEEKKSDFEVSFSKDNKNYIDHEIGNENTWAV